MISLFFVVFVFVGVFLWFLCVCMCADFCMVDGDGWRCGRDEVRRDGRQSVSGTGFLAVSHGQYASRTWADMQTVNTCGQLGLQYCSP